MLPAAGHSVFVAVALLSIALNPLLFRSLDSVEAWLQRRRRLWRLLHRSATARGDEANRATARAIEREEVHAVVAGYGPVGQTVTRILKDFGLRPVVVDLNVDTVTALARTGQPTVYGDASNVDVLSAAGAQRARYILVTLPDLPSRIPVVLAARTLNPRIRVFVRARYLRERAMLEDVGATAATYEEAEAAVALTEFLLRDIGVPEARIADEAMRIRSEFQVTSPRPPTGLPDAES
jgi:CPA2 family monovalent cation:H+ antiporter-2